MDGRIIDAVLACRAQGSRLYGKPLQNLATGGPTVLECQIEYLRTIKGIRKIILAVSEEPENEGFIKIAERHSLPYYRGSQIDVLGRIIKAARAESSTNVFRVTTECPFLLSEYADNLIDRYFDGNYDYAVYNMTPEGTGFECVSLRALEQSHAKGKDNHRSELVTSYIFDNRDSFKILFEELPEHLRRPEVRLTVDFAEDLILCQNIYRTLKRPNSVIPVADIIKYWDTHPEIRKPVESIGVDWGHGRLSWELVQGIHSTPGQQ